MKRPKDIFDRAASGGCVSRLVRFFIFRMQEVVVRYDGGYVRHVWNGPRSTKEIAIKTHRAILAAESCGKVLDVDARVIQGRKLEAVMKIPIIGSLIKCAGKWCSLEVFSQERDELRSDVRANHCDGELPSGSAADSESGGVGIHKNSLANVKSVARRRLDVQSEANEGRYRRCHHCLVRFLHVLEGLGMRFTRACCHAT